MITEEQHKQLQAAKEDCAKTKKAVEVLFSELMTIRGESVVIKRSFLFEYDSLGIPYPQEHQDGQISLVRGQPGAYLSRGNTNIREILEKMDSRAYTAREKK